jgi:hypothetical protein
MIIEHFDFEVLSAGEPVYEGSTYFGFFTRSALEQPEGIRKTPEKSFQPPEEILSGEPEFTFADEAPLNPDDPRRSPVHGLAFPSRALRMIDRIDLFLPAAGPSRLGYLKGSKNVNPDEWFFRAHFHQDPVWPGSLGLESCVQLL